MAWSELILLLLLKKSPLKYLSKSYLKSIMAHSVTYSIKWNIITIGLYVCHWDVFGPNLPLGWQIDLSLTNLLKFDFHQSMVEKGRVNTLLQDIKFNTVSGTSDKQAKIDVIVHWLKLAIVHCNIMWHLHVINLFHGQIVEWLMNTRCNSSNIKYQIVNLKQMRHSSQGLFHFCCKAHVCVSRVNHKASHKGFTHNMLQNNEQ